MLDSEYIITPVNAAHSPVQVAVASDVPSYAYGISVQTMPHRDALVGLKHLLLTEEQTDEHAVDVLFKVAEGQGHIIGKIHLTIDTYMRIERLLSTSYPSIRHVVEGEWQSPIAKTELVHTTKLSLQSVYDYI